MTANRHPGATWTAEPGRVRAARLIVILGLSAMLGGCVGLAAGGAVTGATMANDRRTAGTFVEDQAIELKAAKALIENKALNSQVHINVTSYNTVALVTGEAPSEELRQQVIEIVRAIPRVRQVYDEIAIAPPSSLLSRGSDSVITTKVKAQIIAVKNLDATRVKVVTERGIVYLLGLLSAADADRATEVARAVGGVQKVVKLFEYVE